MGNFRSILKTGSGRKDERVFIWKTLRMKKGGEDPVCCKSDHTEGKRWDRKKKHCKRCF